MLKIVGAWWESVSQVSSCSRVKLLREPNNTEDLFGSLLGDTHFVEPHSSTLLTIRGRASVWWTISEGKTQSSCRLSSCSFCDSARRRAARAPRSVPECGLHPPTQSSLITAVCLYCSTIAPWNRGGAGCLVTSVSSTCFERKGWRGARFSMCTHPHTVVAHACL